VYAIAAKVVRADRQIYIKITCRNQELLEAVLENQIGIFMYGFGIYSLSKLPVFSMKINTRE